MIWTNKNDEKWNTQELKTKTNRKKIHKYQIHKINKLQTKKQWYCSSYYYHVTYCTKRFRDKAYITTGTLFKCSGTLKYSPQWETENILYHIDNNVISQMFLKTVYFAPWDLWNDGATAYVSYTNLQAPKIEIKTGSKADALYAIITNLLLKFLKNSPSHSNFRLQASKFNLVN